MILIKIMFKGNAFQEVSTFIGSGEAGWSEFHLFLYMLEKSDLVLQFTVSDASGKITDQRHFGFGQMEKWVSVFDYSRKA